MISEKLKEKLLSAKTVSEFKKIGVENGNPKINDVDDCVLKHFGNLSFIPKEKQVVLYKNGVHYEYRLKERNNEN